MNKQLHDHVTATAFNLTLSKGQIKTLHHLISGDRDAMLEDGRFLMYLQGLQRRGLVMHHELPINDYISGKSSWTVTKAGELAYGLVIEAGLIESKLAKTA